MNAPTMDPDRIERLARRRAAIRMGWYIHAVAYIAVNLFLASLSALSGRHWAVFPAFGWGIGLAVHGAVVSMLTGGSLLERLVAQERRRLGAPGQPR